MAYVPKAFRNQALPENYFGVQVKLLRILGIELLEEESRKYIIYSRLLLFFMVYSFTFGEAMELYSQWGDLNAVVNVVNYLFTHVTGGIKVTLLFYNRKKMGKMIKLLHEKPFAPDDNRDGGQEKQLIRKIIKITHVQLIVYFCVVSTTVNSGAVACLKSRIFDAKEEWQYPFVPITILNTTNSPLFEMASIYQYLCVLIYAGIIASTYVLLSTIMAHLSVQFKILSNAFRTLRDRARAMHEKEGGIKPEGEYMKDILREYIDHHLKVLRLTEDLEELIHLMVLAVMLASIIQLCFLLYRASLYPLGSLDFMQNFSYYWIIACQVSMYCYWGNEVTLEAGKMASAVAEFDWPGAPKEVSKALVLIIARCQKPVFMTIGKFFPMSMDTLMSILKGSFSYFMVLRQTQDKTRNV